MVAVKASSEVLHGSLEKGDEACPQDQVGAVPVQGCRQEQDSTLAHGELEERGLALAPTRQDLEARAPLLVEKRERPRSSPRQGA